VASKTEIFNGALIKLGTQLIADSEDLTVSRTAILDSRYNSLRKVLLVMHPWNFAMARAKLNKDTVSPVFGFTNQFILPAGNLRVVATKRQLDAMNLTSITSFSVILASEIFSRADNWKVEGTKLLNDNDEVSILYITDITAAASFSPAFAEALSALLAAETSYKITGGKVLRKNLLEEFNDVILPDAQRIDGQEGTMESINTSSYVSARF